MSFGLGIVGAGAIGNVHADAARRAGVRIVGAWDVHPERATALCARTEGSATASLAELLAMPGIDGVAIAVPNDMHMPCAIQALKARKHVLLEKPMALNAAQCREILAARGDRVLQVGFVCRGTPTGAAAARLAREGRFGRIYHLKASLYRRRGIPGLGGWFTQKKHSGGGPLIDLGVHVLDLALHIAGHPRVERVSGAAWGMFGSPIKDYVFESMWAGPPKLDGVFDVEDGVTAFLRCAGGITIELNATWAVNMPDGAMRDGIAVWGDRAGAFFEVFGSSLLLATQAGGKLATEEIAVPKGDAMELAWDAQYAQFVRAIRDGVPPHASGEEGLAVQEAIDAIYASSEMGREVEIPKR